MEVLWLGRLLAQSPLLTALLIMAIIAMLRWQRHPRVSGLVLTAVMIWLLSTMLNAWLAVEVPLRMTAGGQTREKAVFALAAVSFVHSILQAASVVLLAVAAFAARPTHRPTS